MLLLFPSYSVIFYLESNFCFSGSFKFYNTLLVTFSLVFSSPLFVDFHFSWPALFACLPLGWCAKVFTCFFWSCTVNGAQVLFRNDGCSNGYSCVNIPFLCFILHVMTITCQSLQSRRVRALRRCRASMSSTYHGWCPGLFQILDDDSVLVTIWIMILLI